MMLSALLLAVQAATPIHPVTLKTPEGAREPQVAVGPHRHGAGDPNPTIPIHPRLYVVCGTQAGIYVAISRDAAESFEPAERIATVGSLALGMRRGPRIAVTRDAVVVTAIAGEQGGGRDGDLLCWRSTDEARTWGDADRINLKAGSAREGLHAMAAGPNGELFCAWIDLALETPRIYGSDSRDSGAHWTPVIPITRDSDRICPCCHPSAAFDANGQISVMWRGDQEGARDMIVATSKDHGTTFSSPTRIGSGTWKLEACPMDGGALVSSIGRTMTIWRREQDVIRSEPGGPEIRLGPGEQPWITAGPAGFYCVWLTRRGGPLQLWWTRRESPLVLDETANDPVIASFQSNLAPVIAAWESGPVGHPRIVAARIDRVPPD